MDNRITKLSRDPFYAASANGLSLVVDSRTGDILTGSAGLRAWKGLVFCLIPGSTGQLLRLQYRDITIDVGWTDDAADAANWVEAVNRFLETKRTDEPNRNGVHAVGADSPAHIGGEQPTSPIGADPRSSNGVSRRSST